MTWWVIEVAVPGPLDHAAIAAMLAEETGQAVEERPDRVIGCAGDEAGARRAAGALTDRFGDGLGFKIEPAEPVDWSSRWREGLGVRRVGRLRIGPSWLLAAGPDTIVVDPETAFGTGEHGSTRGALALLERYLLPGATVLDLGSGSGILAIAAVKLGAAGALGIEVDAIAIPIARANAAANDVADRVRFTDGDAGLLAPLAGPVDLVVSNILRTVNTTLLQPIHQALRPAGTAIFAGMETTETGLFRGPLERAGFDPFAEVIDESWWSVAARRR